MDRMKSDKPKRGFTLIELMVVICIVALLLGLLIPALGRMSKHSISVHCMSNLRTMTRAATLYAIEHDARFPPALLHGLDHDANTGDVRAWDYWKKPDGTIQPGLLWTYTDQPGKTLQCPGYIGPANWDGDPFTGYNYNTAFIAAEGRMAWGQPGGSEDFLTPKDNLDGKTSLGMAECRRTSTTALFGIGGWKNGANKFMRSPVNASPQDMSLCCAGTQGFHYGGSTNFACVDGHVERLSTPFRGQHFDSLPTSLSSLIEWPSNGFLSDDASRYDPR